MTKFDLISEFVEPKVIEAVPEFINATDVAEINRLATVISGLFNAQDVFAEVLEGTDDSKLIASFKKNLTLLIQKTWVEKTDEAVKEQVLYNLEQFCAYAEDGKYADEYARFSQILSDVVYLMFGPQSKEPEFESYALRIDPEFGIFWWYVSSIPKDAEWESEKNRVVILLGMYFLANY